MDYVTELQHRRRVLAMLLEGGRDAAALAELSILIESRPTFAYVLARANLLTSLGRETEAIPDLEWAILINPESAPVLALLKRAYAKHGGCSERMQEFLAETSAWRRGDGVAAEYALQALFEAVDSDPSLSTCCNFEPFGDRQRKIRDLTEELEDDPTNTQILFDRAFYYHCGAKYEKALQDYETIIRTTRSIDTRWEATEYASEMLRMLGRLEEADKCWDDLFACVVEAEDPVAPHRGFPPLFRGTREVGRHKVVDYRGEITGVYDIEYSWSAKMFLNERRKPTFALRVVAQAGVDVPDCKPTKDALFVTFENSDDSVTQQIEFDTVKQTLEQVDLLPDNEYVSRSGILYNISFETAEFGGSIKFHNPNDGVLLQIESELFLLARKVAIWSGKESLLNSIQVWRKFLGREDL